MEYQEIINLLDNTPNQLSKFKTKNWIEINDQSRGVYSSGRDIRFKTTMLKSSLCDYDDSYIFFKGRITITGDAGPEPGPDAPRTAAQLLTERQAHERNKDIIFKNCAPFTNCKSEIKNTEIGHAKDIDIVISMYNLIEYSDNYFKTSGSLWQYYKDEPNDNLADSESFKYKVKITGSTPDDGNTKKVEIIVTLKYSGNFSKTLEMPLLIVKLISF